MVLMCFAPLSEKSKAPLPQCWDHHVAGVTFSLFSRKPILALQEALAPPTALSLTALLQRTFKGHSNCELTCASC